VEEVRILGLLNNINIKIMLSRVANNLIWLERYMERGNGILGLLKVNYYANQDSPALFSWTPIIKNFTPSDNEYTTEDTVECIEFLVLNTENTNSIVNIVKYARENARSVQEHISRELWLCINNYYLYLTNPDISKKLKEEDPIIFLDNLKAFHLMYYGSMDNTQERGPSYYFLNVGRYLERVIIISDFTSLKLLKISQTSDMLEQSFYWKNLLLSIGGYRLYIKTHKSLFEKELIIKMIFQDQLFPRSIYYCITKISDNINKLVNSDELERSNLDFLLGKLESTIKYKSIDSINAQGFEDFIKDIKEDINEISFRINTVYYSQVN